MREVKNLVLRNDAGRWAGIFLALLVLMGTVACGGKGEDTPASAENTGDSMEHMSGDTDMDHDDMDHDDMEEEAPREKPRPRRTTACAVTEEEMSEILKDKVTGSRSSGNWGIASTCTYSTASAPVAAELSSAATTNLSTDRMVEGFQDIADLGDDAVWVPALRTLAVVDKGKGKLLRIRIGVKTSDEERLRMATAIARLALTRL